MVSGESPNLITSGRRKSTTTSRAISAAHSSDAPSTASATWAPRTAGSRGEAIDTPSGASRSSTSAIANEVSAIPFSRIASIPASCDEADPLVDRR